MKNFNKTIEPFLSVEITKPTQKELDAYYKNTGEIKISNSSQNSPREFKKARVISTYNKKKYPIGSVWMMGESPGMKINFFGDQVVMIQDKDLYAQVEKMSKLYLEESGWEQDKDLYWHKDGHEYNYIDEILWIKGNKEGIWNIDTSTKLEKELKNNNGE